jgi:hypothetical protein
MLLPLTAIAQQVFEVGVRGGVAGYNAQCTYVKSAPNLHTGLLLSYSYHSPYVIGIRAGVAIDRHKAGFSKASYTDTYTVIDKETDKMQIDYTIGRLREDYTTWSVGIPMQIAFSWDKFHLYLGTTMVFPFSSTWQQKADEAALSVYYEKQDNRVYESYPLAASRSFSEKQDGTKSTQKMQWWFSAEFCYDIQIYTSRRYTTYLSLGIYADYSFAKESDPQSDRISMLMLTDTRDSFPLHRILTPVVSANRQNKRLVSNRIPFDVGIKVALRITPNKSLKRNFNNCLCINSTHY